MQALPTANSDVLSGLVVRFGALGAWGSRDINIRYGVESHLGVKAAEVLKLRVWALLVANTRVWRVEKTTIFRRFL